MKIKSAEELLRNNDFVNSWGEINPTLVNIFKTYAAQFIDLAAEKATATFYNEYNDSFNAVVNKKSILKIKKQIK